MANFSVSCTMADIADLYYIDQVKNGDHSAYAHLVNRYKDMVYSIAIKILRNTDDAQDAAQDSFIKAYQQIHKFEGKAKFSTWLYTIAYRTSITRLKGNRVDTVLTSDEADQIPDNQPGLSDQLQAKQVKQHVKAAIDKLPPQDALLITLYYINDLPVKEIEEITGLTKPNVKIKLFRARKVLEQHLKFLLDNDIKAGDE